MADSLVVLDSPLAGSLSAALQAVDAVAPLKVVIDGLGGIVDADQATIDALNQLPGVIAAVSQPLPDPAALGIPPDLQPWLAAWNSQFDPSYLSTISSRPSNWFVSPALCSISAAAPPTGLRLTGDVAAGVIVVNGPAGTPTRFGLSELADIMLAVLHGMNTLYRNAPTSAKLVFLAETRHVTLGAGVAPPPGPVANPTIADYEAREAPWRDAALQSMGFQAGWAGLEAYRSALLTKSWPAGLPQQAVVSFFTKYPAAHVAYASTGRLVYQLDYARVDPGSAHFNRVFAHELCHLFEAPDEYLGCDWSTPRGPFDVINGNCVSNPFATMGHFPCLMNGDSDDLCGWSKAHLGWLPFP